MSRDSAGDHADGETGLALAAVTAIFGALWALVHPGQATRVGPARPSVRETMPLAALFWAAVVTQQLMLAPTPPLVGPDWPGRLHLLDESLRVPFGEDWGGETHYFVRFNRLDVGIFARAWSEAICDRPDCVGRGLHAGAEVKVNVTPALDVGLDVGGARGATQRTGSMILPRLRLKF